MATKDGRGLTVRVRERLQETPEVSSARRDVEAIGNAVRLSGVVPYHRNKLAAVEACSQVTGVAKVLDQIRVEPDVAMSDDEIVAHIAEAMHRLNTDWCHHVSVTSTRGRVRLSGFVSDAAERLTAEATAGQVDGVRSVENLILVDPQGAREDLEILEEARRALQRTGVDCSRLTLKSVARNLLVRGTVDDAGRRAVLERALRTIRGVRNLTAEVDREA
jgi:osmotically-inducible protein OsmY